MSYPAINAAFVDLICTDAENSNGECLENHCCGNNASIDDGPYALLKDFAALEHDCADCHTARNEQNANTNGKQNLCCLVPSWQTAFPSVVPLGKPDAVALVGLAPSPQADRYARVQFDVPERREERYKAQYERKQLEQKCDLNDEVCSRLGWVFFRTSDHYDVILQNSSAVQTSRSQ